MRIYYYCLVLLCLSACGKKSQTKQSLEQKPTKTFYKIDLSHDFTGSNDSLLLSDIVENDIIGYIINLEKRKRG